MDSDEGTPGGSAPEEEEIDVAALDVAVDDDAVADADADDADVDAEADVDADDIGERFSFSSFVGEFCDFLTVAIHTIIYEREIYPANMFIQARKYNHPVRQARHPKLCSWIQDAVGACHTELLKCAVSKICVIMVNPKTNQVVERFVFDVSDFPIVPLEAVETPLFTPGNGGTKSQTMLEIEEQYRAAIIKLSLSPPRLGKLPAGCTFSMSIELKEDYRPEENGDISLSWISMEPKNKRVVREDAAGSGPPSNIKTIPVRRVSADTFPVELWIEKNEDAAAVSQEDESDKKDKGKKKA